METSFLLAGTPVVAYVDGKKVGPTSSASPVVLCQCSACLQGFSTVGIVHACGCSLSAGSSALLACV